MKANVRKATLDDLGLLVKFTAEEAKEAEDINKIPNTLEKGITDLGLLADLLYSLQSSAVS